VTRIGDLVLEHSPTVGPFRPLPLLLAHGMNGGAWYLCPCLYAAAQAGWDSRVLNLCGIGHSMTIRGASLSLGPTRVPVLSGGLRGAC